MATNQILFSRASAPRAVRTGAIRNRILDEHRLLRGRLDVLELLVDGLQEEPKRRRVVSRVACATLRLLIAHTRLEDAILAPALRTLDAWGDVRARNLLEHHAAQRAELTALIEGYEQGATPVGDLAARTLLWISDVRADMEHEERTVLSAALLNDDTVAIDGEAG